MLETLKQYLFLEEPNLIYIVVGSLAVGIATALTGVFSVLRHRALFADVVGHSVLPGVAIAFLFSGELNLGVLIVYASVVGFMSGYVVDYLAKHPLISVESAMGITLVGFFAVGLLLVGYIQGSGVGSQSGIQSFLFGNAASIAKSHMYGYLLLAVILLCLILVFKKLFVVFSFQQNYLDSFFKNTSLVRNGLNALTVVSISMAIQAMGVILVSALLIFPGVIAKTYARSVKQMLSYAALYAFIGIYVGVFISYTVSGMPTGPWVVIVLFMCFLVVAGIKRDRGGVN